MIRLINLYIGLIIPFILCLYALYSSGPMSPGFSTTTVGCSSSLSTSGPSSSSGTPLRSFLSSSRWYGKGSSTQLTSPTYLFSTSGLTDSCWLLVTNFSFKFLQKRWLFWFCEGHISAWDGHRACMYNVGYERGCGHKGKILNFMRIFRAGGLVQKSIFALAHYSKLIFKEEGSFAVDCHKPKSTLGPYHS